MKNRSINRWYLVPAILMLALSQFEWPYGYYQLLRIVVTITAGFMAYVLYDEQDRTWFVFLAIAILFNPLVPVHLERELWAMIDFVTAGIFTWLGYRMFRGK